MTESNEQPTTKIGDLWIPSELANDKRVPRPAKSLYSYLRSLICGSVFEYCFPSNENICEIFGVSDRTATLWLTALEEAGYIERKTDNYNGRTQRHIFLSCKFSDKDNSATDPQKVAGATRKNLRTHNNKKASNKKYINKSNACAREEGNQNVDNYSLPFIAACESMNFNADEWTNEWYKRCKVIEQRSSYERIWGKEYIKIFDEYLAILYSAKTETERAAVLALDSDKFSQILINSAQDRLGKVIFNNPDFEPIRNRRAYVWAAVLQNYRQINFQLTKNRQSG